MKSTFTLCILLLVMRADAQLTITPGASLHLKGQVTLTLENISFINDGQFFPDSSIVLFNGSNSNRSISGSGNLSFHELHIDKPGQELVLQAPISVGNRILFDNGHLFIGNHDVNLGRTGILQGEFENERLRTTGTGRVIAMRTLNGAINAMPGNLGISITTTENLGDVVVRRGHLPQSGSGLSNSIQRYYEIEPQFHPPNANATLHLAYFDAELNGFDENVLHVHRSSDGSNWNNIGFTVRQTTMDYVEHSAVSSFGRFTLAGPSGPLPVRFVSLSGRCEGGKVLLYWQTAQEEASLQFEVQRNSGGAWTTLGTLPSAGNSTVLRSYSFTDPNPQDAAQYRIAEKSVDGKFQYSAVLRITCQGANNFRVYPNPARTQVFVQVQSKTTQRLRLQLRDAKGALVKEQSLQLQSGANVLSFDLTNTAAGTYHLSAIDAKGERLFSSPVLKQ